MAQGAGGGSGDTPLSEGQDGEKLEKYNIDVDNYNHTNLEIHLAILIYAYYKKLLYVNTMTHNLCRTGNRTR